MLARIRPRLFGRLFSRAFRLVPPNGPELWHTGAFEAVVLSFASCVGNKRRRNIMKRILSIACLLILVVAAVGLAQKASGVNVLVLDKATDFSKFKTYEWAPGHKALDPAWDKAIIDAIDKALAAQGLKKGAPADVLVEYHAVQSEEVDLRTFDNKAPAQGQERASAQLVKKGALAIDLRLPAARTVVWRVAAERAITATTGAERDAFVAKLVATMFESYPKAKR